MEGTKELKPKRVLMINDHIHFGGGGDAAFQLEKKIIEQAGHQVFTYSIAQLIPDYATERDVIFIESSSRVKQKIAKFIASPDIYKHLKVALKSIEPDLIRLHLLSKYPADIYRALEGYSVVQTLHGPNLFCATSWGVVKMTGAECEQGIGAKCFTRGCVSLATLPLHMNLSRRQTKAAKNVVDAFTSPSRQLAETSTKLGFTPIEYFPLSIDPLFETLGSLPRDSYPSVLYVGALVEQKGLYYLLEAFKYVLDAIPNAILKLAGRGEAADTLRHSAERLGIIANLQFLGFVGREEVISYYRKAHVVAVPSIWREQFGLVGPEALACRTPCVGSEIGGIPEWLHDNKSGYLIPPRNSKALAEKLIKLLGDEALRLKFGDYGRSYVLEQFNVSQYKSNVLRLVNEYAK